MITLLEVVVPSSGHPKSYNRGKPIYFGGILSKAIYSEFR